jgi:hypothetical protein
MPGYDRLDHDSQVRPCYARLSHDRTCWATFGQVRAL